MAVAPPTAAELTAFHDPLAAAHGPQHWWSTQDRANPRFEILIIATGGFAAVERLDTATLCRELRSLHGIGPETADMIALYAFDRPRFIADAYAFRILERYGWWQGARHYERLRESVETTLGEGGDVLARIARSDRRPCQKPLPQA